MRKLPMSYSELNATQRQMYQAAQLAKAQLTQAMTAKDIAEWWSRWYRAAGHKFLAYSLMDRFGVRQDYLRGG